MATGFGAKLVGRIGGGMPHIATYFVPASDSTELMVGDFVKVVDTTGAMDTPAEYITITRAATGNPLLGVITGFRVAPDLPYTGHYRAASTARYVEVCDDPNAIYEIQEDGVTTPLTAALVGALSNADIIVASGSTATGYSGTMLNSDSAGASAEDLKILGIKQDGLNALGTAAIIRVRILSANHALVMTDSQV